jgi:hypothetical protein
MGGDFYAVPAAAVTLNGTAVLSSTVHGGATGLGGAPGAAGYGGTAGPGGAAGLGGTGNPAGQAGIYGVAGGYGLAGASSATGQAGAAGVSLYPEGNILTTTTRVTSNHDDALVGQPLTFSVTVADTGSEAPIGSVEFYDGMADLGAASERSAGHDSTTFAFTTTELRAGTHTIDAVFTGAENFLDSSGSLTEKIEAATTTAITANHTQTLRGQAVTFTATVTDTAGGDVPTGRVEFFDGSTYLGAGTLIPGNGAIATDSFTTTHLPAGKDPIIVVYEATGDFVGSRGEMVETVTVPHAVVAAPHAEKAEDRTAAIDRIFGEAGWEPLRDGLP